MENEGWLQRVYNKTYTFMHAHTCCSYWMRNIQVDDTIV